MCKYFFYILGRFTIPEEFSIEHLYDIYVQKHAFDDLGFSVEFKARKFILKY